MNKIIHPIIFTILSTAVFAQPKEMFDRFGGSIKVKGTETGYFHIEKLNQRYILVTPDGHGFFPVGVNHIGSNTRQTNIPEFRDEKSASKKILSDLNYWNMNNGGSDCPHLLKQKLPFWVSIGFTSNPHWLSADKFHFEDVFCEEFLAQCDCKIAVVCKEMRNNPYLIGYYWTDTPRWGIKISRDRHMKDWVTTIRELKSDAPGKQQYVKFLEEKYVTISAFNQAYGLDHSSFSALLDARFDHIDVNQEHIIQDDTEFLGAIAEHLYGFLKKTFLKHDPNHLIFGEKYIAPDYPEPVLQAAMKYVDVISIQPGPDMGPGPGPGLQESKFNKQQFDYLHELTGLPVIVCDHQVSFKTLEYPVTLWHQFETEKLAGEASARYMLEAASQAYLIGYNRCQYIDHYDPARGLLKQGLLNENGNIHETLSKAIADINNRIFEMVYKTK